MAARLRAAVSALAVLAVSACGSTVQVSSQSTLGGGSSLGGAGGLAAPGSAALPGGSAAPGTTGAGVTVGAGGTSGGSAGGSTTGTVTSPGASDGPSTGSAALGRSGPGVTDKAIYVGLIHDVNAGAVNKAAGVGAITSGDSQANTRAIIDDINKHGGIAGRKLVPVYADFDSTSTQTLDQQYAAVCQQFTQDSPRVFAVVGAGIASYRACIAKAGVVMLSSDLPTLGAAELARYPGLVEMGYPNIDRLAAYEVTPLIEQKYFTPWNTVSNAPAAAGTVKVGILTYNDTVFSGAVDRYLVPALKKLGYDPQVARIAQLNSAADISGEAAAVKSAQLSFAANGVTHVIPFEANGGLSLFFLANARSQGYYPRYGINSASGFQALMDAGAATASQVHGAVGFGWIPGLDMPAAQNPPNGRYSNAARRECLKVMKDHQISFDSSNAEGIALGECAALYLLRLVVDKTPAEINVSTFARTAEGLRTAYQPAGSLGQDLRPGRHDPADKAYHLHYFDDCGCFHYDGSIRTVP